MKRNFQFASLEEAFAALPEDIREHSLRVEKYADLVFMEVCASDEYIMNMNSRVRLRYENRSMIGLAARYHDVGKILVPSVYHWSDPDFSPEEFALYRRHNLGGEQFARDLLKDQSGVVPMLVDTICEGITDHHEWWDGNGTPKHAKGEDITIVGRIVAVADELDHLLMETRTETPVATAMDKMMSESGTRFDPIIMGLMNEVRYKIEKIFAMYRADSQAIPQTPHIIRRGGSKRPMWLQYRPIMNLTDKHMVAVEADMVFRRGKSLVGYGEVEKLLRECKKVWETQMSFVVEAGDMINRMGNCQISAKFVALNCIRGFWKRKGAANSMIKLLEEIDIEPSAVCFIMRVEDPTAEPSPNLLENCQKLREFGCLVMYAGVPIADLELETVYKLDITHVCLHVDQMEGILKQAGKLKKLYNKGIAVLAEGVERHNHFNTLTEAGIQYAFGNLLGEFETENEFISGELALVE